MSSRTKGFFEQDQRTKPRPGNWHRNYNRATLSDTTNVAAPPRPPVPATSQAKSKLKAFQFVAEKSDITHNIPGDKENGAAAGQPGPIEPAARLHHHADSSSAPQQQSKPAPTHNMTDANKTPQMPHANTFPSTPGARLSLEDLIGNVDDSKKPEPREESPEEHVGWIPNSSSTELTPNRKRKRARSSSPSCPNTSSQRAELSAFFAGSAEKRTPEADPAADLWQRYGIGRDTGDALKLPDFNNAAFQGSPRPLETPVKSSGLRRWASTGNDWPSSKSKKRRTNGNAKVNIWQTGQAESGGRSKVAAMVEKIQESLATQKFGQAVPAISGDEPSSSSPLPDTASDFAKPQRPVRALEPSHIPRMDPPPARIHVEPDQRSGLNDKNRREENEPIFTNNGVRDESSAATLHLQSKAPLPAFRRPSVRRTPSEDTTKALVNPPPMAAAAPAPAPSNLPLVADDFDEFGDDMDFTTEDLDELMSQPLQNRSLHDIPAYPNPPPQPKPQPDLGKQHFDTNEESEDDEFACDDLDETSFMEAELQATQAHRASLPSSKYRSK